MDTRERRIDILQCPSGKLPDKTLLAHRPFNDNSVTGRRALTWAEGDPSVTKTCNWPAIAALRFLQVPVRAYSTVAVQLCK
jgi:hypothetical protein